MNRSQVRSCFGLLPWILLVSQAACPLLSFESSPKAVVETTVTFEYDYVQQPIPRYRHSYFTATNRNHNQVRVWDRLGVPLLDQPLSLPGVDHVSITAVAASATGQIALTASAMDAWGRSASFVAWLTIDGKVTRVVRTTPFMGRQASFDSNGTLWVLGRVADATGRDHGAFDILRNYAPDGALIGSALPNTAFASTKPSPAYDAHLALCGSRILVASSSAQELVEVDKSGKLIGKWPLETGNAYLTGFACMGDGAIAASWEDVGDLGHLFRFDRDSGRWTKVSFDQRSPDQGLILMGSDNNQWVIRTRPPIAVHWATVR